MLESLKPYAAVIKAALFVILFVCVAISYYVAFHIGVSQERAGWELKVSEAARLAAEERLKDIEEFHRKINEQKAQAEMELARAREDIKGFEDYVASIKDDSSCLTPDDTRKLRKLWNGVKD
jgi:hypothetical protein